MRRKLGVLSILTAAALPLAVVSVAYACGVLATLHLNRRAASPGATVSGFGGNYSAVPAASPVALHFNNRAGRVLWTGRPDLNGTILPSFAVPNARPGYYLIDATQTSPTGTQVVGTPGRAVIRIGNPKHAGKAAAALWPTATSGSGGGSYATTSSNVTSVAVPTVVVATLSGFLLAGGIVVLVGDRRRSRRPLSVA